MVVVIDRDIVVVVGVVVPPAAVPRRSKNNEPLCAATHRHGTRARTDAVEFVLSNNIIIVMVVGGEFLEQWKQ